MNDDRLVTLMKFDRINEAEMAKSLLESAGIFGVIRNEYEATVLPIGSDLDAELMVYRSDVARATELLHAFIEPELTQSR